MSLTSFRSLFKLGKGKQVNKCSKLVNLGKIKKKLFSKCKNALSRFRKTLLRLVKMVLKLGHIAKSRQNPVKGYKRGVTGRQLCIGMSPQRQTAPIYIYMFYRYVLPIYQYTNICICFTDMFYRNN